MADHINKTKGTKKMNDLELLKYLEKHDAVNRTSRRQYVGQIQPTLNVYDVYRRGKIVWLPDGIRINRVVSVLERHGLLLEKGLTPRKKNSAKMFDNPNLHIFDVSHLHEQPNELTDEQCDRLFKALVVEPRRHVGTGWPLLGRRL